MTEYTIEQWDYNQLAEYLAQDHLLDEEKDGKVLKGFMYLRQELPSRFENQDPYHNYCSITHKDLTVMEIMRILHKRREQYHHALITKRQHDVVGALIAQWVKFHEEFWHYHIRFVDVREDCRNQGIATKLLRTLNEADFLKQKILYMGMLSVDGERYLRHIVHREMKARDYALVFEDYIGPTPITSGIYGGMSWG